MEKKPLIPRKIIKVGGKIHYSESRQSWSNIKFKRELINEFPQLKDKRSAFSYELTFFRNIEELNKAIKELTRTKEIMPILMFLYKEG